MGAISVNRSLDKADELYKQANRMMQRNPNGAKKLKAKAAIVENKAISRVGRKPRNIGVSTSAGSVGRNTPLNWY